MNVHPAKLRSSPEWIARNAAMLATWLRNYGPRYGITSPNVAPASAAAPAVAAAPAASSATVQRFVAAFETSHYKSLPVGSPERGAAFRKAVEKFTGTASAPIQTKPATPATKAAVVPITPAPVPVTPSPAPKPAEARVDTDTLSARELYLRDFNAQAAARKASRTASRATPPAVVKAAVADADGLTARQLYARDFSAQNRAIHARETAGRPQIAQS